MTLVAMLPALPHCPSWKTAKSGEHHIVVTVRACMTRRQLPERVFSIPRVWYDNMFARRCSEATVIEGSFACESAEPQLVRCLVFLAKDS